MNKISLKILSLLLLAMSCVKSQNVEEPVDRVNVFIGTTKNGNTTPAAHAPFGMISFGPTNVFDPIKDEIISRSGYDYEKDSIKNFSLTHVSGWGCHGALDIPFMPTIGSLKDNPLINAKAYASAITRKEEIATPGYYGVHLKDVNIHVKGAVSERSGIIEFKFPVNEKPKLLFMPTASANGVTAANIQIEKGGNRISGYATSGGFCSRDPKKYDYTVYFTAEFNRPIANSGGWNKSEFVNSEDVFEGTDIASFLAFDKSTEPLTMKVAISFVSIENAKLNLEKELADKSFEVVHKLVREKWNNRLSKMKVTSDDDTKEQLFTALYHNLLHPNIFEDINGQYRGFNDSIYVIEKGRHKYVNFSTWDTYRTTAQLQGLLFPTEASDMVHSLILDSNQGSPSGIPIWGYFNNESWIMNGHSSLPLIANMYAFGARNIDLDEVKDKIVWVADNKYRKGDDYIKLGYVPYSKKRGYHWSISMTLEYAIDDYAVAQMCKYNGDKVNYKRFLERSDNIFNLLNEETLNLQRKNKKGKWVKPIETASVHGFEEGNSEQYIWNIPHNLPKLVDKIGGNERAIKRLDKFTSKILTNGWFVDEPYYWPANQPSFIVPYVYVSTGTPKKADQLIHRSISSIFKNKPDGMPGNDDLGATSAMYLFQVAGFYPLKPGTPEITLTKPMVHQIEFFLENGAILKIVNNNNKDFTEKIRVNGKHQKERSLNIENLISKGEDIEIVFD